MDSYTALNNCKVYTDQTLYQGCIKAWEDDYPILESRCYDESNHDAIIYYYYSLPQCQLTFDLVGACEEKYDRGTSGMAKCISEPVCIYRNGRQTFGCQNSDDPDCSCEYNAYRIIHY